LARARAAGRLTRGIFGRRLEHAGQHRGFGERHIAHRFAEIIFCRGVDAEGAAAEIGAIEIKLENLVLGEMCLQPQRQERFVDLTLNGALVRQEQVLGELLRERRTALHYPAGLGVGQ
jgi:hypothetical protein